MTGRPSKYTEEIADEICTRICQGEGVARICEDDEMPPQGTVYVWLQKHESFREKYARARETQQDFHAEQLLEIVDEEPEFHHHVGWARNRMDARKWLMSKLAPKKYGDKVLLAGADGTSPAKLEVSWQQPELPSTTSRDGSSQTSTLDHSASLASSLIVEQARQSPASTISSEPPLDADWSDPDLPTSPPIEGRRRR